MLQQVHNQPVEDLENARVFHTILNPSTTHDRREQLFYKSLSRQGLDIFCKFLLLGNTAATDKLIDAGYNPNRLDRLGENIVHRFGHPGIDIAVEQARYIYLYLLSKNADVEQRNLLNITGKDLFFIKYNFFEKLEAHWEAKDDDRRKVFGFEFPVLYQMLYGARMLVRKTHPEIRDLGVLTNTNGGVVVNTRDYLFGFVKIASFGLLSRLLNFLSWYEANRDDGDISVVLNVKAGTETLLSYAHKVRKHEQQIMALLIQAGVSTKITIDGRVKEFVLQTINPNPPLGLSKFNIVNAEAGVGPRQWARYVLVDRQSSATQQASLPGQ